MGVNSRFGCLHGETLAFSFGGVKTGARQVRAEANRIAEATRDMMITRMRCWHSVPRLALKCLSSRKT